MASRVQHAPLNPDESAALTRLLLGFCLGKGSLCLYSRSYVLQISQPKAATDYSHYQWRRLRQFLPTAKEPKYHQIANAAAGSGQWRLRTCSRHFVTAWRLLYGEGQGRRLNSNVLELLGAEAIATLWADRGRILMTKGANFCNGRLNLSAYGWEEAELVHDWIYTLTGAQGRVHHGPRSKDAPMLYYDTVACEQLMESIDRTWMAQAECLARKFRTPRRTPSTRAVSAREELSAELLMPQALHRRSPVLLQKRKPRRVPGSAPLTGAPEIRPLAG
jgi:hypothetical protein